MTLVMGDSEKYEKYMKFIETLSFFQKMWYKKVCMIIRKR